MRSTNTKEMIARQGAEVKFGIDGAVVTNAQPGFNAGDPTVTEIVEGVSRGISGVKFQTAMSFFLTKGLPLSLARTYGAALMDAAKATGKDISDLIVQTNNGASIRFTDESLASLNIQRPKTSQIGYRLPTQNENALVLRTIAV